MEPASKRVRAEAPVGEDEEGEPFGFPFPPYDVQLDFMRSLYSCLEEGGVGIFESPTGTGKSLSLICGALRWLTDQQHKEEQVLESQKHNNQTGDDDDDFPSWVDDWCRSKQLDQLRRQGSAAAEKRKERAKRLERYDASMRRLERVGRRAFAGGNPSAPKLDASVLGTAWAATASEADDFLLADWQQGAANAARHHTASRHSDADSECSDDDDLCAANPPWRIYYCSRTHSQLSQVIGEVRKTSYASRVAVVPIGGRKSLCTNELVRTLGSSERVNDACLELQTKAKKDRQTERRAAATAVGGVSHNSSDHSSGAVGIEAAGGGGCPFHKPASQQQAVARQAVADRALLAPHDVEELGALGRREGCCAYYAARDALADAQLVLLPYSSLLHEGTRASLGLSLRRAVVIVDEAHNLIDTINDTHSVVLTARQLSDVSAQLGQYAERYHARLKPANRLCVQQLLQVVRALRRSLLPNRAATPGSATQSAATQNAATQNAATQNAATQGGCAPLERIVRLNDFLAGLQVDHLNLFELSAFCEGSQIAKKLRGFADAQAQAANVTRLGASVPATGSSIHGVVRVLEALMNADEDGRVLLHIESSSASGAQRTFSTPVAEDTVSTTGGTNGSGCAIGSGSAISSGSAVTDHGANAVPAQTGAPSESYLKVLHLRPSTYFSRVLDEAHAVVLAGGTMQPIADLERQLFDALPTGRLRTRSYGHIVPSTNLLPLVLPCGPAGVPLQFTFGARGTPTLIDELGRTLVRLAARVPDGVVVFLPSFGYEEQCVTRWKASGLWAELNGLKRVFREPREAAELDAVLKSYATTIEAPRAAATVSAVLGGALLLSVVGGKMSEGINFADGLGRCVVMVGLPFANPSDLSLQEKMAHLEHAHGKGAGREYYTNTCMKAVNQSIGRAIRHISDYATIVLADSRFAKASIRSRLPGWIGDRLHATTSFDQAAGLIDNFFDARASHQAAIEQKRRNAREG